MNLLFDPWIPVQKDNAHRHITLKELLCQDERWTVSLPRDDLEMACLQLLIALTQALFIPKDFDAWLQRQETPLTGAKYDQQAHRYMDWFDLDHVTQPFMQRRDVKAEKVTPIQNGCSPLTSYLLNNSGQGLDKMEGMGLSLAHAKARSSTGDSRS